MPIHRHRAFTLIELLVVISIIALLIALLLPALGTARASAQQAVCKSQSRNIFVAFASYRGDHRGFHHDHRNWMRWIRDGAPRDPRPMVDADTIAPGHTLAYWGVAYVGYIGGDKRVYACPSTLAADDENGAGTNSDGPWAAGHVYTTYGFNGYAESTNPNLMRAELEVAFFQGGFNAGGVWGHPAKSEDSVLNPSSTILFQDAWEAMIDGNAGGDTPIQLVNQWSRFDDRVAEYFRHVNATGNIMWADGHASEVQRERTKWDEAWYIGVPLPANRGRPGGRG